VDRDRGLSLLIPYAAHWPLFKLWLAALVGGICSEAWNRLIELRHRVLKEAT
jgi:hypothetical protein